MSPKTFIALSVAFPFGILSNVILKKQKHITGINFLIATDCMFRQFSGGVSQSETYHIFGNARITVNTYMKYISMARTFHCFDYKYDDLNGDRFVVSNKWAPFLKLITNMYYSKWYRYFLKQRMKWPRLAEKEHVEYALKEIYTWIISQTEIVSMEDMSRKIDACMSSPNSNFDFIEIK